VSTAIVGVRPSEGKPFSHARDSQAVLIRNAAGRVVGSVRILDGRRTFLKTVDPDRHQLHHPPAWANDRAALDEAERAGAELVCHRERRTRRRWWAPLAAYREHGFPVRRGHGDQVGLMLKYWQLEDPREPVQLGLFLQGGA
jgi:hypothetical protein